MVLCFCLLVLVVDQGLGVQKLLLNILQVLFQDLFSLEILVVFFVDLLNDSFFFPHELVKLFILIIGKLRQIVFFV